MTERLSPELFLVFVNPDARPPEEAGRCVALGGGLYIVESQKTRSGLYHTVKAHSDPEQLLVAPLAGDPKFKGMAPGALAALRQIRP